MLGVSLLPWLAPLAPLARAQATATTLLMVMLVVWLAEQVFPANPAWNARPLTDGVDGLLRLGRDLFYLFGVTQLTGLLTSAVDGPMHQAVTALRFGREAAWWPVDAALPVRMALAFLLVEFFAYWFHRAAHRFKPLWQFHSTHHVLTELNGLKAVRTHPVDNALFSVARLGPLLWLGAGADELMAATFFGGVFGILAHANVSLAERGLNLFFNLPRAHSVHHSADLAEASSNFGCHTVVWDRVFGTFRSEPAPGLVVGVTPVGRRSVWQELVWPFYRKVGAEQPRGE